MAKLYRDTCGLNFAIFSCVKQKFTVETQILQKLKLPTFESIRITTRGSLFCQTSFARIVFAQDVIIEILMERK